MIISVYTDGSCSNHGANKGEGSFGYAIIARRNGKEIVKGFSSKKYFDTTSQRMELSAIIKSIDSIDAGHKIDIYSDSEYCVKGINQWLTGWIKGGILNDKANPDLWEKFIEVRKKHISGGSTLKFSWVRGHNGNKFNELADRLSRVGRAKNYKEDENKFLRV